MFAIVTFAFCFGVLQLIVFLIILQIIKRTIN
jgi:hypothetical protein